MSTLLLKRIAEHHAKLERHIFCQHLHQRQDSSLDAYRFVPHMTFFVLGFRDILEVMQVAHPVSECELALNTHCQEDAEHWHWFIEDLQTLQMDTDYWGGSISSILSTLWSRENYPVRELVYRIISHIHNTQTAEEKMIIMECLESAFSVFINNLNTISLRNGYYQKLKYFGSLHYEDEANHTAGTWLDGKKPELQAHFYVIHHSRLRHINTMIDNIFAGFDQVLSCWDNALPTESTIAAGTAS